MEAGVLQTVQSTCTHLILLPFCHGVIASQAQTGQTWPQFVSEHSGPSLDRFSDVKSKVRLSVPTGLVSVRKQIWREVKKTHKHTTKDKTAQPTGAKLTFFIYFYLSFCCYSGQGKKKSVEWREEGGGGVLGSLGEKDEIKKEGQEVKRSHWRETEPSCCRIQEMLLTDKYVDIQVTLLNIFVENSKKSSTAVWIMDRGLLCKHKLHTEAFLSVS